MKRFLSILCTIAMLMSLCVSLPVYAANGPSADGDTFVIADFSQEETATLWMKEMAALGKLGSTGYETATSALKMRWLQGAALGTTYLANRKDSTSSYYDSSFEDFDFNAYDALKLNVKVRADHDKPNSFFTIVLSTSDMTSAEEVAIGGGIYRKSEFLYKEFCVDDYNTGEFMDIIVPFSSFTTAFDQIGAGASTPVGSTPLSAINSISFFPQGVGDANQIGAEGGDSRDDHSFSTNSGNGDIWLKEISVIKNPVITSAATLDSQMAAVVDGGTRKDLSLPTEIEGVSISWSSDNAAIATNGTITQPESGSTAVNLTAALSMSGFETITRTYTVNVLAPDTGDFLVADFTDATTSAQWRAASHADTNASTGYDGTAFKMRWLTHPVGVAYIANKSEYGNSAYDKTFVPLNFEDYKAVKLTVKIEPTHTIPDSYFTVVMSTSEMNTADNMHGNSYQRNEFLYKELRVGDYKTGDYVDIIIPLESFTTAYDQIGAGESTPVGSTPLSAIKSISVFPEGAGDVGYMNVPGANTGGWSANTGGNNIWLKSLSLVQDPIESAAASLDEYMTNYDLYGTRLDLTLPATMGSANVSWSSDNTAIATDGTVTQPESGSVDVTLTATVSMTGFETQTKTYTVTVYAPDKNDFVIVDFSDPQAGIDWRASTGAKDKGNGWDEWDGGRYSLNWLAGIGGGTYLADHPEKFAALDVSDYSYIQLNIQPMLSIETDRTMAVVLSTGTLQDNSTVYKNHEILYYEIDLGDYTPSTSGYYKITIPFNKFKTAFDQVGNGASTPVGSTPLSAIKSISIAPIGMQQYGVTDGNAVKGWAFNKYAVGDTTYHMACTLKSITLLQDAPLEVYSGDVIVTDVNFKKLTESNALKGKVEYTNKGVETANVTPVIAVYTNGVLSGVQMGSAVAVDAGATATITTPELTYNPTTNTDVKVYMWDMAKGMTAKMSSRIHSK